MVEKPTTVRLKTNVKDNVEEYMRLSGLKKSEAINFLIEEGMKRQSESMIQDIEKIIHREYELGNFFQLRAFLEMKKWEAKERGDFAIIKKEELERIDEFIKCFSDLAHNSNMWAERLHNEGYTMFAKIIRESKEFM